MVDVIPLDTAPTPIAVAGTSPAPIITGVPSLIPVLDDADFVINPEISSEFFTSGNFLKSF